MKLIVGLGNPGPSYVKTRHNIGRRVAQALAETFKGSWKKSKGLLASLCEIEVEKTPVALAVLDSFMNESGKPVSCLVKHFKVDFEKDLLVVIDDAVLPFGKLRLRAQGQDGGHRGLKSIQEALKSQNYARLRIGIAPPTPTEEPLEDYVLNPFRKEEEVRLKDILEQAAESCRLWVTGPITRAMDFTNKPNS